MKSKVYIEKEKALKEVFGENVNLQLNSDWSKAIQGKKHILSFIHFCFRVV